MPEPIPTAPPGRGLAAPEDGPQDVVQDPTVVYESEVPDDEEA